MPEFRRVCVYCGSNSGKHRKYADAAKALGRALAARDLELVYGGADKGLMGMVASTVLAQGGRVIGVIPELLMQAEVQHEGLTECHVVDSMHARKAKMESLSDAFIALPGGFGTLDEVFEILTWGQLNLHGKPCGLMNVDGYFDDLLRYLDNASAEGFLRSENRQMILVDDDAHALLAQFDAYVAPNVKKWV